MSIYSDMIRSADAKIDGLLSDPVWLKREGEAVYTEIQGYWLYPEAQGLSFDIDGVQAGKKRLKVSIELVPEILRSMRWRKSAAGPETYQANVDVLDQEGRYWIFEYQEV